MTVFWLVLIVITLGMARADARRYGVHPFRRLAPDDELNQP
jgi:hypothetical protein